MKTTPSSLFTNTITVVGAAFLMFNLKKEFADPMYNNFLVLQIFILNAIELQKNYKSWKNNKPQQ
jgi:hypothetical protein